MKHPFYSTTGKRLLDLVLAVPALILLSPLFGLLALIVYLKLGSPVLFRQERAGLGGHTFRILKFRSMTDKRDQHHRLLPDGERLTGFGQFLRSTSLDELPELFNVIKGELSLVGPRPLLKHYLPLYSKEQARRHDVKPGITGWSQINGRNALSWEERFRMDVWYVDHLSLLLDLKILMMTLAKVARREGISAEDHATMMEFSGTQATEK
ncbi:MAG TPA: sugar transferase [Pyrinomonadaceae bacterium]|jgi:lipopolysaccharide/colanic/teichoic acid biosynthesis glycosyltransferase|nr:sugar transferase [Pyrinomonadaceae bacterium]